MFELLRHPDQAERVVVGDEDLAVTAADEVLRMVTAVHHFRRTATEDVEMRGEVIRAGDKVAMWYTSANRDEDVFEEPNRFDVGRKPNRHLTFGIGPHFCLGPYLARLEIKIALEELRPHLGRLELVSGPERLRSKTWTASSSWAARTSTRRFMARSRTRRTTRTTRRGTGSSWRSAAPRSNAGCRSWGSAGASSS